MRMFENYMHILKLSDNIFVRQRGKNKNKPVTPQILFFAL